MRVIGLLACHSTELREDVPVIEVSLFDFTHISVLATTFKYSVLILKYHSSYTNSTQHLCSVKLLPKYFLIAQEWLCWIIFSPQRWVMWHEFFFLSASELLFVCYVISPIPYYYIRARE